MAVDKTVTNENLDVVASNLAIGVQMRRGSDPNEKHFSGGVDLVIADFLEIREKLRQDPPDPQVFVGRAR